MATYLDFLDWKKKIKQWKTKYLVILGTFLNMKNNKLSNVWSNNYSDYESNGNINKTLSVEGYLK